jgi:hypothetical protein
MNSGSPVTIKAFPVGMFLRKSLSPVIILLKKILEINRTRNGGFAGSFPVMNGLYGIAQCESI